MGREKRIDTSLLDRAIKFAVDAHEGAERRGKGFPYVVHPLEVVAICATITSDQEILAAAALHDVIEDTPHTKEEIKELFGERIANIVAAESDNIDTTKSECETWKQRKIEAIERLKNASYDSKIVALGDKLSNMRAIARDFHEQGEKFWSIFHNNDPKEHEWHYRGLADSLRELEGTYAFNEFEFLINKTFGKK